MRLSLWDILLFAGILQGVIVGTVILLKKGRNNLASKTISSVLFVCVLAITGSLLGMLPASEVIRTVERYVPFYLTFLLGPLIYFHVRSVLDVNFQLNRVNLWHFLPTLINLIPTLLNFCQWFTGHIGIGYLDPDTLLSFLHFHYVYSEPLGWLHISSYLVLSKRYLLTSTEAKKQYSKRYYFWLKWLINLFLVFQALWCPFMIITLTNRGLLVEYAFLLYLLYIPLVAFIYWISIKYLADTSPSLRAIGKVDHDEMKKLEYELNKLITKDQLYLDPTLNLPHLAEMAKTTPKKISCLLNQHLHTNFNDFINRYRVNEVKQKLADTKYDHLTISAIAFESGFGSIPTFQRAFKAKEHISPKEFQRRARNSVQITI